MEIEKIGSKLYLVTYTEMVRGRARTVNLRIDGRPGRYRIDKLDIYVWYAVDGGEGFRTLREAKRAARLFRRTGSCFSPAPGVASVRPGSAYEVEAA